MPDSSPHVVAGPFGLFVAGALLLTLAACGGDTEAPAPDASASDASAAPSVQLLPSPETAPDAAGATLRIVSPADGARFDEGEPVAVRFELEGYALAEPTPSGDARGSLAPPTGSISTWW
jgi:hypothetical protein